MGQLQQARTLGEDLRQAAAALTSRLEEEQVGWGLSFGGWGGVVLFGDRGGTKKKKKKE
jgi:hypothetical protein